ncbi:MAG: hypothetical protein LUD16_12195 [Lachnospiraceae bacterium]|nr:hypothetical protein [Lachnospiraceae bacterium]
MKATAVKSILFRLLFFRWNSDNDFPYSGETLSGFLFLKNSEKAIWYSLPQEPDMDFSYGFLYPQGKNRLLQRAQKSDFGGQTVQNPDTTQKRKASPCKITLTRDGSAYVLDSL